MRRWPDAAWPDAEVERFVSQDKQAIVRDDYRSANKLLSGALDLQAVKTASTYARKSIVYALDFESPAEEYQYQTKQYHGNQLLLKLMLEKNQPSSPTDLVGKYVAEAR